VVDPTNTRVYITGLSAATTENDIAEMFGQIGTLKREKQKRGYPDQWPYKIKMYKPGQDGGDAVVAYEDPGAAGSAPSFFNGADLKGAKITVQMASKPPEPEGGWQGGGGGGRGGRGGGGGYGGGRRY
jgi:RNA-binding protein FUS